MSTSSKQDIIIKRVKKIHHGGHGGAWKIAYADFVTAMMAFFLLMWLINAASEDTKKGIAEYFTTAIVTFKDSSGADGMMSGQNYQSVDNSTIEPEPLDDVEYNVLNSAVNKKTTQAILEQQLFPDENTASEMGEKLGVKGSDAVGSRGKVSDQIDKAIAGKNDANLNNLKLEAQQKDNTNKTEMSAKDKAKEQEKYLTQQVKKLEKIMESIKEALNSIKELEIFKNNLILELTNEGLKIQIMDDDKNEMFKLGDPTPMPHTQIILGALGKIIAKLPNKVSITGHTDSKPYVNKKSYSNSEPSSDRAHSTRRILEESGVDADHFMDIVGKSDREPFNKQDHFAPENRRISIMISYLLSEKNEQQDTENDSVDTKSKEAKPVNKPEKKMN